MTGRLLAQLAWVVQREADATGGDRYAWPPPPPVTPDQACEARRLDRIARRLFRAAEKLGVTNNGTDSVFGEVAS